MTREMRLEREQILNKVVGVFMTKGYEGTSVKDLVDATGLHPGSLYNTFGSKQGIFESAIEHFDAISPFNRLLDRADTAPPRDTIRALLDTVVYPHAREEGPDPDKVAGCLITFSAAEIGYADEKLARRLEQSFENMEDRICTLIARGQQVGEFANRRDARDLARFLLSTVQGIQVMAKVSTDRTKLEVAATLAFDMLEPVHTA